MQIFFPMSEHLPLVTIGAANFNNSRYVIESLESIKSQTYPNIELVIVDDASKDDSPALIEEWLKTYDKPYRYIRHEKNGGLCRTCNDLITNANGKYISLIGTDDLYVPDKIAKQVDLLEKDTLAGMVYTDTYLIDENGKRKFGTLMTSLLKCSFEYAPSGDILKELQQANFIHGLSMLIRKSVYDEIGGYDEALPFEDYDMNLRIAKRYKVIFMDDILCLYRIHSQSYSSKTKDWATLQMPIFFKHIELPVFREKIVWIIMDNYRRGIPIAREWAIKYNALTKEKFPYYSFVRNSRPVLLMRLYCKLRSIV